MGTHCEPNATKSTVRRQRPCLALKTTREMLPCAATPSSGRKLPASTRISTTSYTATERERGGRKHEPARSLQTLACNQRRCLSQQHLRWDASCQPRPGSPPPRTPLPNGNGEPVNTRLQGACKHEAASTSLQGACKPVSTRPQARACKPEPASTRLQARGCKHEPAGTRLQARGCKHEPASTMWL